MGTGRPSDEALARARKGSKTGGSRKGMIDLASGATEKAQQEEAIEAAKTKEKVQRIKKFKKYFELTAMELCRKLDANGDKKIDREEVQKGAPEMSEFYDEWDRNKDGILSQTDLVIGFCTCRNLYRKVALVEEKVTEENEPQSKLQEFMSRDPQELFAELDKNKDGSITNDELNGIKDAEIVKRFLNRLDSDRDEKVSKDEFVRGITNMKSRMKSGYRRN
ncbi:MAG: EF-hand domain-containing protein, partial [Planctomycetia bacterium]|nr:EF-hand domain-containing protein [Planctomycetia bacterium]